MKANGNKSLKGTQRGIRFRRTFRFDYSDEGIGRHTGHIRLVGISLEEFSLGLPAEPMTQDHRKP